MLVRDRTDQDHAQAFAAAAERVFPVPTPRQEELLDAMFAEYFSGPRPEVPGRTEQDTERIAAAYSTTTEQRALVQMLILVEMCRGEGGGERQALALERLARELGVDEDFLLIGRDAAMGAADLLTEDWQRLYGEKEPETSNVALREAQPEAVRRLRGIEQCAPGTVGRALHEFYARHGEAGPGDLEYDGFAAAPHDVHHVIAGYGTTDDEESRLLAFLVAATRGTEHFYALTASVARQEMNALDGLFFETTWRPKPVDLRGLVESLALGEQVRPEFASLEVLDVLDEQVEDVRRAYGVPARRTAPSYEPRLAKLAVPQREVNAMA